MRRLTFRERQQRIAERESEAWGALEREASDPGLRRRYESLPRAPIRLIVPALGKAVNHGGILRVAEAFRLEAVDFEPEPDGVSDLSGGVGSTQWQPWRWIAVADAVAEARARGAVLYGVTLEDASVSVSRVAWRFPAALVFGEEKFGLGDDVVDLCDELIAIPLFGLTKSLNVASAAAVVAHRAIEAYCEVDSSFEPARALSRRLLG